MHGSWLPCMAPRKYIYARMALYSYNACACVRMLMCVYACTCVRMCLENYFMEMITLL